MGAWDKNNFNVYTCSSEDNIYANSGVLEKIRAEAKCLVKVCTV